MGKGVIQTNLNVGYVAYIQQITVNSSTSITIVLNQTFTSAPYPNGTAVVVTGFSTYPVFNGPYIVQSCTGASYNALVIGTNPSSYTTGNYVGPLNLSYPYQAQLFMDVDVTGSLIGYLLASESYIYNSNVLNALTASSGTITTLASTTLTATTGTILTMSSNTETVGSFGLVSLISILSGVPSQPFITLSLSVTPRGFVAGASVTFVGITGTASIMNGVFTINSISSPGNFFLSSNPGLAVGYYNPGTSAYVYLTGTGDLSVVNGSFVGSLLAPTVASSDNSTNVATTAFVKGFGYAPLASPAFTGVPTAPTATAGTNTTQLATTAFTQTAIAGQALLNGVATTVLGNSNISLGASAVFQITGSVGTLFYNQTSTFPYVTEYAPQVVGIGLTGNTWATVTAGLINWVVNGKFATFTNSSGSQATGLGIGVDTTGNPWLISLQPNTAWRKLNSVSESYAFYTSNSASSGLFVANAGNTTISSTSGSNIFTLFNTSTNANYVTLQSNSVVYGFIGLDNSTGIGLFGSGSPYGLWFGTPTTNPVCFATNNLERMRITSTGYVGIGTTNPSSLLTIGGSGDRNTSLRITTTRAGIELASSGTGGSNYGIWNTTTGEAPAAGGLVFYDNSASAFRMVIAATSGNIGIAGVTNPSYTLDTNNGSIGASQMVSGIALTMTTGSNSLSFNVYNGGTQSLLLNQNVYHNIAQKNNVTLLSVANWQGGTLFTQTATQNTQAAGLNVGHSPTLSAGYLIALAPSVAWQTLYLSAGQSSVLFFGSTCSFTSAGGWNNISDQREKTNIKPLKTNRSLERVLACKTVTYNRVFYKDASGNDLVPDKIKQTPHVGLLAQDQLETNPHCISTWENEQKEERYGLNYQDYTVHLIGAVQQQQATINELQKLVKTQQALLDALLLKYPL
jgi:hypothetical protein